MPANFPDSPTLNQTYTYGAMTWQWTGSYWSVVESANYTAVTAITANLVPSVNEVYNLGSATLRWRDLYLSGNSLVLGAATISASGSAITLPANSSIGTTSFGSTSLTTEDLTVTGNLTVNGTTTTINSTTLSIDDKNIVLADGAANAAAADGAGITVAGASATLTYASASDTWNVNKNILITPGTANGVLYLNASKVATTGSVLTFDGAQLGVNGITVGRGAGAVSTNTALGASALAAGTTADYTTAIGHEAALSTTTATRVTAVGSQSLRVNTTGRNTAFGWASLYSNVTGTRNTALGDAAIYYGTGDDNTAVGYGAMLLTTTGVYNVAMGSSALRNGTTGSNSTAIGYQALYSNTTASYNTALGYQAGYANTTGNSNTYLGWNTSAAGAGNTGSGNLAAGFNALNNNTSGTSNTALGGGIYAVMASALESNTTGNYNVAVGTAALKSNTTASNNTAVGYQAGYSNTTGIRNVFIGQGAGYSMVANSENTFVGRNAGNLTTGGTNTFVGEEAGASTTTGTFNSFFGTYAGADITTGSKNTIIGRFLGNQGGLDIRTANNYVVLSDGDGTPRLWSSNTGQVFIPGNNGARPVELGGGIVKVKGESGGWEIGYRFGDQSNNDVGAINAAGSNNSLSYIFIAAGGATSTSSAARFTANGIGLGTTSPATSGMGITFPATQSASSDANTLDDYEEGTWTPVVTSTGGTYANQAGRYTKVGRVVTCDFFLQNNSAFTYASLSALFTITGLPFTPTSWSYNGVTGTVWTQGFNYNNDQSTSVKFVTPVATSSATILFRTSDSAVTSGIIINSNNSGFIITGQVIFTV